MTTRRTNQRGLWLVLAVAITGCGGSSGTSEPTTTTRITVLPETTLPAFEPTDVEGAETTTTPVAAETTPASVEATTTIAPAASTATSTSVAPAPETTVSSTTTTAPAPAGNAPSLAGLVLGDTGIGGAQFGAEPDGVVMFMSSFLGEPTADTGYVDPFEIGACPGTELRLVSWGSLTLTFGDVSRVVQGQRHFYAYSYGIEGQPDRPPLGLATEAGITLGSPLPELLLAFPNMVINPADEFTPPNFFVNDDFRGYLTGLADDSTVSVIFGGLGCGE